MAGLTERATWRFLSWYEVHRRVPLQAADNLEVEPQAELQAAWRSGSGSSGVKNRGDCSEAGVYLGDISGYRVCRY